MAGVRALALLLLLSPAASAAARLEVPVDLGVGPAAYLITGPVFDDQPVHFGLKISLAAVIDRQTIERNKNRIPKQYRKLAAGVDEVRITPSVLIPDALILSPKVRGTGLWGVTWRPVGVGVPLARGRLSLRLDAGLLLTYAFLHSDALPNTHFLRPGVDLGAHAQVAVTKSFLVSLGWSSGLYVPQKLGAFVQAAPLDQTMWHLGQAWLKLHFRFPYQVSL